MEGDAILRVQSLQLSEVAEEVDELRWDGATDIIRGDVPERATMQQ